MVWKFTRRSVLALAGSLAALGLGLKSKAGTPPGAAAPQPGSPLPEPSAAPFDTVVVLMMENRGNLDLAQVPVTRIGQGSKVVLELKLTDEARALRASSDRMPALLETTVTDEKGPVCRNVFSSILTRHDSR